MSNQKGKMVLGGIEKDAVKIYFQEKRKSKLQKLLGFHFCFVSILLLFSYLIGDYNLLLLGVIFSTITITADSATQFESGGAEYNDVARLDDNTFVIAFRDVDDNNSGKVIIGTRSGTTISIVEDSAIIFESGETEWIALDVLDSTHFIIAYRDKTDSNKGKVIACSVSGTTITLGNITVFKDATVGDYIDITTLDDTYFVISYNYSNGKHIIGSVSGTTITLGAEQSGPGTAFFHWYLTTTKFTTTKIIFAAHKEFTNSVNTYIGTIDIGAKTISWGANAGASGNQSVNFTLSVFNDIYFIIGYVFSLGGQARVRIGSISGNTISYGGSEVTLNSGATGYLTVCTLDSTHFITSFRDIGNTSKGTVRGGSISGTTITLDGDGEVIFENDTTSFMKMCKLMSNYFIIPFKHG